jgi:hypothetical protein
MQERKRRSVTELAVTLEAAVKSGAARALRQSLMNSYDICARRAQYDLEPPGPRRTSEAAIIGTGYHAGLEHYYGLRLDGEYADFPPEEYVETSSAVAHNTIVDEIGRYDADCITWDTNPTNAIKIAQEMLEAYLTEGHVWGPEYKILGVEVPFWLPSGYPGWVSHGTIDLVLEGPVPGHAQGSPDQVFYNGIILDDHKTSSRKWDQKKHTVRKTAQVATYMDAYDQLSGCRPDTFSFSIMKRDGQFERRYVNPSDAELTAFYLKRDLIVRQLSSGDDLPPNTTSNLCSSKWCSWWNACPFGAAMEGAA